MFKNFASGIIGFALTITMCCCGIVAPANAACDKAEAKNTLALIEQTVASRQDSEGSAVVWYNWRDNWDRMTPGQKRNMVQSIGGLEQCLTGKAVRIRYAGKDVARYSLTGKVEIYE